MWFCDTVCTRRIYWSLVPYADFFPPPTTNGFQAWTPYPISATWHLDFLTRNWDNALSQCHDGQGGWRLSRWNESCFKPPYQLIFEVQHVFAAFVQDCFSAWKSFETQKLSMFGNVEWIWRRPQKTLQGWGVWSQQRVASITHGAVADHPIFSGWKEKLIHKLVVCSNDGWLISQYSSWFINYSNYCIFWVLLMVQSVSRIIPVTSQWGRYIELYPNYPTIIFQLYSQIVCLKHNKHNKHNKHYPLSCNIWQLNRAIGKM